MEIEIVIYKENGKYYTSEVIETDKDIPLWEDNFKEFIRKNIPAKIGEGFIVINDIGEGFHSSLWKYSELF